jgi:NOL1/NOP2/fmu family ribosome biogenesis protein
MFRKSPSLITNWEKYGVDYYSQLQKEIIIYAAKMLKPGGMMLYSTCTFSPEENEGTIMHLLQECPDMHVIDALPSEDERKRLGISFDGFDRGRPDWVDGHQELKNCIRLWPHRIDGEGHFIALLRKDSVSEDSHSKSNNYKDYIEMPLKNHNKTMYSLSDEAKEFLSNIAPFNNLDDLTRQGKILILDERIYLLPEFYEAMKGLRTLRQGLLLGEMKKKRFQPSQALASALKTSDYKSVINLSSKGNEAISYLKCQTLSLDTDNPNGWQLIAVDGYPLGWGKLNKGILKNMYQPGWRWM